jgi:hypothetical protein
VHAYKGYRALIADRELRLAPYPAATTPQRPASNREAYLRLGLIAAGIVLVLVQKSGDLPAERLRLQ